MWVIGEVHAIDSRHLWFVSISIASVSFVWLSFSLLIIHFFKHESDLSLSSKKTLRRYSMSVSCRICICICGYPCKFYLQVKEHFLLCKIKSRILIFINVIHSLRYFSLIKMPMNFLLYSWCFSFCCNFYILSFVVRMTLPFFAHVWNTE